MPEEETGSSLATLPEMTEKTYPIVRYEGKKESDTPTADFVDNLLKLRQKHQKEQKNEDVIEGQFRVLPDKFNWGGDETLVQNPSLPSQSETSPLKAVNLVPLEQPRGFKRIINNLLSFLKPASQAQEVDSAVDLTSQTPPNILDTLKQQEEAYRKSLENPNFKPIEFLTSVSEKEKIYLVEDLKDRLLWNRLKLLKAQEDTPEGIEARKDLIAQNLFNETELDWIKKQNLLNQKDYNSDDYKTAALEAVKGILKENYDKKFQGLAESAKDAIVKS